MLKTVWIYMVVFSGCMANGPPAWLKDVPDAEAVGAFHTVGPGQTLLSICRMYKADIQEVAEVNGIDNPDEISVGQVVFIPDIESLADSKQEKKLSSARKNESIRQQRGIFVWPVEGVLTSRFGLRHGRRHDGIDIAAPEGTPIRAAASGTVLYVGQQRGYGNLVILKHEKNFITVYAHNRANLVTEGQRVKRGQLIAELGRTGRATGPHVHFEIRQGTKPRNPLFFLPKNN